MYCIGVGFPIILHGPLIRYVKLRVAHAPGPFSPPPTSKDTASQRSQHASRHVRDARAVMHVGIANPLWRENIPGIPGACATCNFTYLVRGPWRVLNYNANMYSNIQVHLTRKCIVCKKSYKLKRGISRVLYLLHLALHMIGFFKSTYNSRPIKYCSDDHRITPLKEPCIGFKVRGMECYKFTPPQLIINASCWSRYHLWQNKETKSWFNSVGRNTISLG